MKNEIVKCISCGEDIDLAEGNGQTDENGEWMHEECAMAEEWQEANEADFWGMADRAGM